LKQEIHRGGAGGAEKDLRLWPVQADVRLVVSQRTSRIGNRRVLRASRCCARACGRQGKGRYFASLRHG